LNEDWAFDMSAARDMFAYVALLAAVMAAVPAVIVLGSEFFSLAMTGMHEGPFASETRQAASQFLASSQGAAIWLGLSAIMIGNFLLTRIWASVAAL
jgi:hypothetical protein